MNAASSRGRKAATELKHLYNEKAIANAAGFNYPAFGSLKKHWMNEMVAAKAASKRTKSTK